MSMTKHGAAQLAASKLSVNGRRQDAVAAQYLAWINAQAVESAAVDALLGAMDASKSPLRVLAEAAELYVEMDDFPTPSATLPAYLQQSALSATFARVFTPQAYGAVGNGVADDTAAIQAAVDAARTAGGGRVQLPAGTYKVTAQIDVTGFTKPGGDTWQNRGVTIEGTGVLGTRIVSTHAGTVFRFHSGKMFCGLRNMEIQGPGKATANSRGVFWDGPDGNATFDNLYIHGYAVGMDWIDATLHTITNVAVRECGTGVRTGYNHDIHTFIGCRMDYNDIGVHIGAPSAAHPSGSQETNAVRFLGCRISNNTDRAFFLDDYGASAVWFEGGYFEGNAKEGDIGVSGRSDSGAPVGVVFSGCFWDPYATQAVSIDVYNNAKLVFRDGCKVATASDHTIFVKLATLTAMCMVAPENSLNVPFQHNGLNFTPGARGLVIAEQEAEVLTGSAISSAWKSFAMPGGTGKTWHRWTRLNTSTGADLAAASVRDVGGVMRISGEDNLPAFIAATSYSALPTASLNHRGCLAYVPGNGTTTADTLYVCLMSATGTYSWKSIVAG